MAKTRSQYVCQSCGAEFPQWYGKCAACGVYGSLEEQITAPVASANTRPGRGAKSRPTATPRAATALNFS
ncbi:MAG: DNA repair protein RadA, partial [Cyanobacteriota bacterium]